MKKSIYNIYVHNDKNYLLFNTSNSSCVILTKEEFEHFENNNLDENLEKELYRLGFYVDDDYSEAEYILARNRINYEKSRSLGFRIFTTTNCNARCFYCYENGVKHFDMSKETADLIINFITERISLYNSLQIQWFGGEPLVNYKIIDYITEKLKPLIEKHNIKYSSTMISNGYLFNDELIKKAKNEWQLKKIQITLDGLKETYQKIKQINDENAFEKVLENISKLAKNGIKVSIRLNYSSKNFEEILNLIDFLSDFYKNQANISIYAKRIFEEMDKKSTISMDKKIFKKLVDKKYFRNNLSSIKPSSLTCMANNVNHFVINADGKFLKCARALNLPCGEVGDIKNLKLNKNINTWIKTQYPKKCYKCKLFPLCLGGCTMEKLLGNSPCIVNESMIKYKMKLFLDSQN